MTSTSHLRRFGYTTVSSVVLQISTIIVGLVLPRMILHKYGPETHGLITSISRFLMLVSIMDLGVSEVVKSSLYKPLVENNIDEISSVYYSATRFFRLVALVLLFYIALLCCFYPRVVRTSFSPRHTVELVIVMSISAFCQYFFGISSALLLDADQKGYVRLNIQIIILFVDLAFSCILIHKGCTIIFIKLVTSLVYLARPFFLYFYVRSNYALKKEKPVTTEPLKQKWSGFAQHLSTFVMDYADIAVLTVFSTLPNVSVYSVYNMVMVGASGLFVSLLAGIKAFIGREWVEKQYTKRFVEIFTMVEWGIHTFCVVLFGCVAVIIIPFVRVYTSGITEASYVKPLFGLMLTIAFALNAMRTSGGILIQAAGHYRQTQKYYLTSSMLNVFLSILLVRWFGINGVACGTIIAMALQLLLTGGYCYKNLIHVSIWSLIKQLVIDVFTFTIGVIVIPLLIQAPQSNLLALAVFSAKVFFAWLLICIVINVVVLPNRIKSVCCVLKGGEKKGE